MKIVLLGGSEMTEGSGMNENLEWLARNVGEWSQDPNEGCIERVGADYDFLDGGPHGYEGHNDFLFTKAQWLQARKDLGLVVSDEEERIPAREWNGEMTVGAAREILSRDNVNHPEHYQSDNGIECIDAIRAALGLDGFVAHCRGTAIKYAFRAGKKQAHAEDLRKAAWYLTRAAEALEASK